MEKIINEEKSAAFDLCFNRYNSALEPYRIKFEDLLFPLLATTDPKCLLLFWIHFSSNGVGMTEPVEAWIRRAGDKCIALNYVELGENLRKHAIHEANHHLMMIEDTEHLVARWNAKYLPKLETKSLLEQPYGEAVKQYQQLHEDYIQSDIPYCQIAIEYEIENLSANYGLDILEHTFDILGDDIKTCLSFLVDHARIDIVHTQFNRKSMSQFMSAHPKTLDNLIAAGIKALKAYGNFVNDCWKRASNI